MGESSTISDEVVFYFSKQGCIQTDGEMRIG